jgi:hypothetical protein
MRRQARWTFAFGLCLLAAAPASAQEDRAEKIRLLERRLASLKAAQPARSDEVARVVRAVFQDAERRSDPIGPLLPELIGRDDDGFFLRSRDGSFLLRPEVQFQFRAIANHRDEPLGDDGDSHDTESGFEIRRLEVAVEGNVFTPKLTYEFRGVTEREGGDVIVEDAWVQYEFAKAWAVLFGQFRDPVFHEELVSSKRQLAVEKSLTNRLLASPTGFVQGVSLAYGDSDVPTHAALAFHDGAGSFNTPYTDSEGEPGFVEHFGLAGRVEYKFFGDWKNYKDFTALNTTKDLLIVGSAFDWTQGVDTDLVFATADVQYENAQGWGLYAAFLVNHRDARSAPGEDHLDLGLVVQASYLISPGWEFFARYDATRLDRAGETFDEITVGLNRYLGPPARWGHRLKFTLDLTYLPNGAPADVSALGIRSAAGDEVVARAQFQLVL